MLLIITIVLLVVLKYFAIGLFADLSWWWVAGLMAVAFIWFEFVERMLGLDKRRAHEHMEKTRQERIKKTFENQKRSDRK